MTEVWLRTNRRSLGLSLLGVSAMNLLVLLTTIDAIRTSQSAIWKVLCVIINVILSLVICAVIWLMRRPLLALRSNKLLVNVTQTPVQIPLEIVEGFLLGKQEVELRRDKRVEVATLVIRLAESATDWAKVEMPPAYGRWCGGYINILGLHTEPLTLDLVNRLNARLNDAQRKRANSPSVL